MEGVDLDAGVLQLVRQVHRPRVHRALGDVVGRHALERVDGRRRVLVLGDRPQQAGHVDDAAGVGLAQQRQERLRGFDQAEHVGVERGAPGLERLAGYALAAVVDQDAGVVDQDVEPAVALLDLLHGGGDAGAVGDVQRDRFDRQALRLQVQRGFDGLFATAAGEDRVDAGFGQLADGFAADAAGGAGDQRDLGCGIHVGFLCREGRQGSHGATPAG